MFIEAFLVDAKTKQPELPQWPIYANLDVLDTFDSSIYSSQYVASQNGSIVFTYKIPEGTNGGEYNIKITS